MNRNYYAFTYADGIHTTTDPDYRIAGTVHKFESALERDQFVKDMHYTYKNNQKPCHAILRQHIFEMGHGDYFKQVIA